MARPRWTAVALAAVLGLSAAAGCSSDDATGTTTGTATERPDSRTTYATVQELAAVLDAGGLPCALEYEGLEDDDKQLSLCTLGGEQATLSIWRDPSQLDAFLASPATGPGATAVGANWTVDVGSVEMATQVAEVAGGVVHG